MDASTHDNRQALHGFVDRLEDIDGQRRALTADAAEVYDEVREAGYSVKAVRRLVAERRMDQDALRAFNETLEDYRDMLGQLADTPLGDAATRSEFERDPEITDVRNPMAARPKPFAEQPVHDPKRRGRPRKEAIELWSRQADSTVDTA